MITKEDIKDELRIDVGDTSQDARIDRIIDRQMNYIRNYCNNPDLDFEDGMLDEVLLYLVIRAVNPETSLRAGKSGDNTGFSVSFLNDLPNDIKKALIPYKRLNYHVINSDYNKRNLLP